MTESAADRGVARALLSEAGVRPSKRLGQSFLVDPAVLADVEAIVVARPEETIVEVGPGLGAVTEVLLRSGKAVVAIELDRRLAALLDRRLADRGRLTVVRDDVLRFDPGKRLGGGPVYVVGSLPYRITAPILRWLIEGRDTLSGALLITQREVAEKIAASPGKDGSSLGILVRAYADIDVVRQVARRSFLPAPEVDSTLWRLAFRDRPRFASDPEVFFAVVRALYGARRKMVRSALRSLVPAEVIPAVLNEAAIDGTARGEGLGFEQLDRLAGAMSVRIDRS